MKTFVSVQGLADLDKALGQLLPATQKNVLRRVGRAALQPFDAAWRAKAPVDEDAHGNHLKDSGGVGSKLSRSQRQARDRETSVEIFAGPGPHPKAVQQEFGNSHNAAQPFVRPAWDETADKALDIVRTQLGAEIDKAAKRQAAKAAKLARSGG